MGTRWGDDGRCPKDSPSVFHISPTSIPSAGHSVRSRTRPWQNGDQTVNNVEPTPPTVLSRYRGMVDAIKDPCAEQPGPRSPTAPHSREPAAGQDHNTRCPAALPAAAALDC